MSEFKDTYFFDPQMALTVARQKNRIPCTPYVDGLQLCYYQGQKLSVDDSNLIHVPIGQIVEFFSSTKMRWPTNLVLPTGLQNSLGLIVEFYNALINEAKIRQQNLVNHFVTLSQQQDPFENYQSGQPLRVFVMASRYTTVMQYVSKAIANAFERLGCQTEFLIETNDREMINSLHILQRHYEFNPHLVININHVNNGWLHPHVFNVIWFQDPMPAIVQHQPIAWRQRDIVMSLDRQFDEHLKKCGATDIRRQGFCIDDEVFHDQYEVERQEKIIFVGSSYAPHIQSLPQRDQLIEIMSRALETGETIDLGDVEKTARDQGIPYEDFRQQFYYFLNYIIRDKTVEWMCQLENYPVEVYGRGWQNNPVVKPFYKGEIEHGAEVARLYNTAKYALVAHPHDLNSQRMAEVSACGCIPVVYDCRAVADPPHWEESCLFFKARQELINCLGDTPSGDSRKIGREKVYLHLAKNLLSEIQKKLNHKATSSQKV